MTSTIQRVSSLIILTLLMACQAVEEQKLTPSDEIIWIDVRTKAEFETGHVLDALNIPYDVITEKIPSVTTDKSSVIRVYCRSGRRSGIAQKMLTGLGYKNVTNEGGYHDLMERLSKSQPTQSLKTSSDTFN